MGNKKELAKYLAEEISKSDYLDIKQLESKIYAVLAVMSPIESTGGKVKQMQDKLNEYKKTKAYVLKKKEIESTYWKDVARDFMDEKMIKMCYKQLDEILEENGY